MAPMKTLKTIPAFASKSANKNSLKALTNAEQKKLGELITTAENNGLKNFGLIYNCDGELYGFKTPITNCLPRVKTNKNGEKTLFKIFSPLANGQIRELIADGKMTYYGTEADLEAIKAKNNKLRNNGQAVEYLVKRKEHQSFNHSQTILNGGDALFNDTELKYFVVGPSSSSCRLFDNIKV